MTVEDASEALEACACISSLNAPVGDDDGLTLEGTIADPTDLISNAADHIALSEAIGTLPPMERRIIVLRYYKNMSQEQTGKLLGISQVKVSREEKKIIERLRKEL